MNILTDEELGRLLGFGGFTCGSTKVTLECIARAIESAILSKLAEQAGEPVARTTSTKSDWISQGDGTWCGASIESQFPLDENTNLFTQAQLIAAQQRTAEACAKMAASAQANGNMRFTHRDEILEAILSGEWREYL